MAGTRNNNGRPQQGGAPRRATGGWKDGGEGHRRRAALGGERGREREALGAREGGKGAGGGSRLVLTGLAIPAMIYGGVPLTHHDPRRGTRQHPWQPAATFAPPCMVAGPHGLVLKIFSKADQIRNIFRIWAKNKKNRVGHSSR